MPTGNPVTPCKNYTVQAGDSLFAIAQRAYGDGNKWSIIYAANRQTIGPNPNLLHIAVVLAIPTLSPKAGCIYVVQQGDSLFSIAQRAYDDGNQWPVIYNANRQVIGDNPNIIQPGQVLHIPPAVSPAHPLRDGPVSEQIQGDILAAFNKDHRVYLFYSFPDRASGRAWLRELLPFVAKTKDVAAFNAAFSAAKAANHGVDPPNLKATWVNVSLTFSGLKTLMNANGQALNDISNLFPNFARGSADNNVATFNGDRDPSNPDHSSNPSDPVNWEFGKDNSIHAMLNIQSDDPNDLNAKVQVLQTLASNHGLQEVYCQKGEALQGALKGHEHFGFKDGVSQPGIAGYDLPDPNDPQHGHVVGSPGTEIIQAGEFVLGEAAENGSPQQAFSSANISSLNWMKEGSFQVVRRLRQDVAGFRDGMATSAPADHSMSADQIAAKVVGRWPSGTPLDLSPDHDNNLTDNAHINNFTFAGDTPGEHCPRFAHIRKVYPRDNANFQDRVRRILRRGIAFGPAFDQDASAERGLFFVAYMGSIEGQFEFLENAWVNNSSFPFDVPPQGPDAVIGSQFGASPCIIARSGKPELQLSFRRFVETTGTLYAFVPSLPALTQLANGQL